MCYSFIIIIRKLLILMASVNQALRLVTTPTVAKELKARGILAFLTPCDQAFNPPFLGGKIIELAKFCLKNKDLNQVYRFSVNQ